jgi:type II secretory pathway pseudopilin PulG
VGRIENGSANYCCAGRRIEQALHYLKQQRRALALAWSSAASLLILAALAFFFYGRAQQSERETRQQAAGSTYRTALQEQQQGLDEAALAYLAKAGRLDPENRSIATAMLMLLGNRYWPSLVLPDLKHKDLVNSARFSPHGARVVTASADGTAMIWDARTGSPLSARSSTRTSCSARASVRMEAAC